MTRIIAIALTASFVAFFAVSAKAADQRTPFYSTVAPATPFGGGASYGSYYPPAHAWPRVNQAPAITKTLQNAPYYAAPVAPAPTYENEWQQPVHPPVAPPAAPSFSYPQQGYYPREGHVPQAPGYEYDFGGAGTYPPIYPMEGANWREPRPAYFATGFSAPTPATNGRMSGTYRDCPH